MEKGNLSINSENILPIIKKWLYSDSDIFIRELVSNATDAITKLQKLISMGEASMPEGTTYRITVSIDKENKQIKVTDNGIGMTADEIKQYINQIAFSGASDFLETYKEKLGEGSDIIGHFGLGFYSSFMVADKVQIDSLSHKEGAVPARWICEGGIEFEMGESDKASTGTTVTLYVNDESLDFLEEYKIKEILKKYCNYMPVEIYFDVIKPEEEPKDDDIIDAEADADEIINADADEDDATDKKDAPKPINNTSPLWLKQPKDCTDEEYKAFYHEVFTDFNEPLFWIHLNMDYPFRLKGILYFPKLKHELDSIEGQVKLYNNQVFIADNIKEVIPEFLLLLKGTMDCPDLPLNVSRSFLQNDGYVTKMSNYITKKVSDKLNSLFKKDRENYEQFWDDISQFIKYGCIKETSFYDKIKDAILFKTTNNIYTTLPEYLERNKEKHENKVFYVTNENQQAQYVKLFKDYEMEAVLLTTKLDVPFIQYIEMHNHGTTFARIDSNVADILNTDTPDDNKDSKESLEALFRLALDNEKLKVDVQGLKSDSISGMIILDEQSRRMQEMGSMFGGINMMGFDMFGNEETLILNKNNNVVKLLLQLKDDESRKEDVHLICKQVHDLAMMSHKPLAVEAMSDFIGRSNRILEMIASHNHTV